MNVQVHRALSDLTGTTGMAIVRAIVAGERDPLRLAANRDPHCRKSVEQIAQYLTGTCETNPCSILPRVYVFTTPSKAHSRLMRPVCSRHAALQPPERQNEPVPPHPSPRNRGTSVPMATSTCGPCSGALPAST